MVVTLNIENDAELRAYIKDCIKGQILAITREEFKNIVTEELEKRLKVRTMRVNLRKCTKKLLLLQ